MKKRFVIQGRINGDVYINGELIRKGGIDVSAAPYKITGFDPPTGNVTIEPFDTTKIYRIEGWTNEDSENVPKFVFVNDKVGYIDQFKKDKGWIPTPENWEERIIKNIHVNQFKKLLHRFLKFISF